MISFYDDLDDNQIKKIERQTIEDQNQYIEKLTKKGEIEDYKKNKILNGKGNNKSEKNTQNFNTQEIKKDENNNKIIHPIYKY